MVHAAGHLREGFHLLEGAASTLPIGNDGAFELAFWLLSAQEMVYLRQNRTMRTTTSFLGGAGYPRLIRTGDTLSMAYLAGFSAGQEWDVNSVLIRRSTDEGRTWGEPVLVSRSGQRAAYDLQAALAPDGLLHLVWRKSLKGGPVTQAVWHMMSTDGGRTWTRDGEWTWPDMLAVRLRVAVDGDGELHAVILWMVPRGDSTVLAYTRGSQGSWSPLCTVPGGRNAILPDLIVDGRGRVQLVWNRVILEGTSIDRRMTLRSTLRR